MASRTTKTTPPKMAGVEDFDRRYYPADWNEFIGQDDVKFQLRTAAKSARVRGEVMDHVLIASSIPGCGKTALGMLAAAELGGNCKVIAEVVKPNQVGLMFSYLQDGDVLFIDEAHRLVQGGKQNAEWLLKYMDEGVIATPLGMEPAPKVTIIAATTDAGRLPDTILSRFSNKPTLERYTDEEGQKIAIQLSRKVLTDYGISLPRPVVALAIARAANNGPRAIRNILIALRDLVVTEEIVDNRGLFDLTLPFKFAGVTMDGLSAGAQRYLLTLLNEYKGNPAGKTAIAESIGEVGSGMAEIERVLLSKNLIAKTKPGRVLTMDGIRRAKELAA